MNLTCIIWERWKLLSWEKKKKNNTNLCWLKKTRQRKRPEQLIKTAINFPSRRHIHSRCSFHGRMMCFKHTHKKNELSLIKFISYLCGIFIRFGKIYVLVLYTKNKNKTKNLFKFTKLFFSPTDCFRELIYQGPHCEILVLILFFLIAHVGICSLKWYLKTEKVFSSIFWKSTTANRKKERKK